MDFPSGPVVKDSVCHSGIGLIPGQELPHAVKKKKKKKKKRKKKKKERKEKWPSQTSPSLATTGSVFSLLDISYPFPELFCSLALTNTVHFTNVIYHLFP